MLWNVTRLRAYDFHNPRVTFDESPRPCTTQLTPSLCSKSRMMSFSAFSISHSVRTCCREPSHLCECLSCVFMKPIKVWIKTRVSHCIYRNFLQNRSCNVSSMQSHFFVCLSTVSSPGAISPCPSAPDLSLNITSPHPPLLRAHRTNQTHPRFYSNRIDHNHYRLFSVDSCSCARMSNTHNMTASVPTYRGRGPARCQALHRANCMAKVCRRCARRRLSPEAMRHRQESPPSFTEDGSTWSLTQEWHQKPRK